MSETYYSIKEAAAYLRVSRNTIYALINDNHIKVVQITEGRKIIPQSELENYINYRKGLANKCQ